VAELEIGRLVVFISIRSKCARVMWAILAVRGRMECWGAEFEVAVATEREVGPGRNLPYSNRVKSWGYHNNTYSF
jgi:hypothetical protein